MQPGLPFPGNGQRNTIRFSTHLAVVGLQVTAHLRRAFEYPMISKLKKITRQLRRSKPGRRFVDHYHQNKHKNTNAWKRWLIISLGTVMTMAGLVLSLPPAMPGFLLWIPGLALVASQVKAVAVVLDKLECAARSLYHKIVKFFSGRRV